MCEYIWVQHKMDLRFEAYMLKSFSSSTNFHSSLLLNYLKHFSPLQYVPNLSPSNIQLSIDFSQFFEVYVAYILVFYLYE